MYVFQVESHLHDSKISKSEFEIRLRDLTMQLEISNAQKTEFEEQVKHLTQDIQVESTHTRWLAFFSRYYFHEGVIPNVVKKGYEILKIPQIY